MFEILYAHMERFTGRTIYQSPWFNRLIEPVSDKGVSGGKAISLCFTILSISKAVGTKYGRISDVPYTDVLITDYSLILYDYLLMEAKDAVLFNYDYQDYVNERGLNYPYLENVAGTVVSHYDALEDVLKNERYDRTKYAEIRDRFWRSYRECATQEVSQYFMKIACDIAKKQF